MAWTFKKWHGKWIRAESICHPIWSSWELIKNKPAERVIQKSKAKSLGTLSQKHRKFAHPPSTPNAMLIWRALHTQNHYRRFQHCLGWEGGGQWPKQCDINRATDLRKAFFTNVQFCACFSGCPKDFWPGLSEFGLVFKMIVFITVIHFTVLFWMG